MGDHQAGLYNDCPDDSLHKIAKLSSAGTPYPILVLSGILPWQLLATIFTQGSDSVLANASLITKVYFPRLIIPAISLAVALIDFLISAVVLIVMMIWYGYYPGWQILFLPFFLGLALLFSGRRTVGIGIECKVSRFQIYHSISNSNHVFSFSRWIFVGTRSTRWKIFIFAKSARWHH